MKANPYKVLNALWDTYVTRDTEETVGVESKVGGPFPKSNRTGSTMHQQGHRGSKIKPVSQIPALLQLLARKHSPIPRPLAGIGLWNLVRNKYPIGDINSEPLSSFPPILVQLLDQVLGLDALRDAYRIGAMRTNRRYEVFPPYPDQVILDSRYVEDPQPQGAKARLEICVPTGKYQLLSFDSLRQIIDPRNWSACSLFWSDIKMAEPTADATEVPRSLTARLHLPGVAVSSETVQLDVLEFSDGNPMRSHIRFAVKKDTLLKFCRGYVTVQKEPGCPGAARVISSKLVQFAQAPLREQASAILKYWLQAEAACLVLRG